MKGSHPVGSPTDWRSGSRLPPLEDIVRPTCNVPHLNLLGCISSRGGVSNKVFVLGQTLSLTSPQVFQHKVSLNVRIDVVDITLL